MYWFTVPTIAKHYLDTCWHEGFAYDYTVEDCTGKLKGKTLQAVCTTGASKEEFAKDGIDPIACLYSIQAGAKFTGMNFEPTLIFYEKMTAEEIRDAYLAALK